MKKKLFLVAVLLSFGVMILSLACSKSSGNYSGGGGGTLTNTIYMKGSVFSTSSLTIMPGTKITWVNDDNITHTVTADDGSFNSGDMNPGSSFSYTFNMLGIYNYHCVFHAGMTGSVMVATR